MRPHVAQHARPVVIPAQAGIQEVCAGRATSLLDSRLRGGEAHSRLRGHDGEAP